TDTSVTPSVDSLSISLTSGYKPSQTFTLTPIDVSSIGEVAGSFLSWTEDKPDGTDVVVETSIDGANWTTVTNEGEPIPEGTDLTGNDFYVRYTLSTSDTSIAPTMQSLEWRIAQAEPGLIRPATGTVVLTPSGAELWQLEHKPYATGWHVTGEAREPEPLRVLRADALVDEEGTVELWAQEDGRTMHPRYLFETSGKTFAFYRDTDGTYVVTVKGAPVVTSEMPSEGWHRWSVRWNGTKVDLFRDGTLRASAELGEPFSLIEAPYLFIGCDSDGDNQFNALIDDLALSRV